MKLLLTSFGTSHLWRPEPAADSIFDRMPPVLMSPRPTEFIPDYPVFLLAEELIIDSKSFDRLAHRPARAYATVADLILALHAHGLVSVRNFDEVIENERPLLENMLDHDLKELENWIQPLAESQAAWDHFIKSLEAGLLAEMSRSDLVARALSLHADFDFQRGYSTDKLRYITRLDLVQEAMQSRTKRRSATYQKALRAHLTEYLAYVNSNLVLSNTFDAGFHDWSDFLPFYKEKFFRLGKDLPNAAENESVKKLFEISFPEYSSFSPDRITKILTDHRISELRELVQRATRGEVSFDTSFAKFVLSEVLQVERGVGKFRSIVSYITAPLGYIPVVGTPLQKLLEEAVVKSVSEKRKAPYQWFYLISDLPQENRRVLGGNRSLSRDRP